MKHFIRLLVLAVSLAAGLTTIMAQTVQVQVFQKVPALPPTISSYLDGPFRYFKITFIVTGAGEEGLDVYFDMDMTVNTDPVYVRTRPGTIPMQPIHLSEGVNIMRDDELNTQVLNRTETNFDYSDIFNAQQLPEGTYNIRVEVVDKDSWGFITINLYESEFYCLGYEIYDMNGDGSINIGDISVLVDAIIDDNQDANYDVNGDGVVNISDINMIIAYILS